jgi:histidyl-tRNA synthetase
MHGAGADGPSGMKAQFRRANASGARFALVFGGDELAQGTVGLKDLLNAESPQTTPPLGDIAALVRRLRSDATTPA